MHISKPHVERTRAAPRFVASGIVAAEWIIRRELLWLALVAPFLIFPERLGAWLVAVLPALWIVRFVAHRRFLPPTPLDWPIALLMAMVAVSMFATFSIDYSLPKITGVLLGVGVYYALIEWALPTSDRGLQISNYEATTTNHRTATGDSIPHSAFVLRPQIPHSAADRLTWAVGLFLVAGAGLALVSLFGTNWLDKMQGVSDVARDLPRIVPSLPGAENGFQPNEVAGTLLLVALPALALAMWAFGMRNEEFGMRNNDQSGHSAFRLRPSSSDSAFGRVALASILLITASTLVLTQSRGALLGAVVGLVLVLWLLAPRLRIWLAGALLVGFLILIMSDPVSLVNKLLQPVVPRYVTTDPANVRVRLDFWSSALAAIGDAPLTGIGMNTFRYIMPLRYPSALIPPGYDVAHAHNVFLQVALDVGLPGLLAYIAIYTIAIVLVVQLFKHARGPSGVGPTTWHKAAAAGIGAALVAYLMFGIADTVALGAKPGIFFWALLSLDVALWIDMRSEIGATQRRFLS